MVRFRINNDVILDKIDSILNYKKISKYHTYLISGTILFAGISFLLNLFAIGVVFAWLATIIKLLGYKYAILSKSEISNLSINKIDIEQRKKNMFFFFWFIPISSFAYLLSLKYI